MAGYHPQMTAQTADQGTLLSLSMKETTLQSWNFAWEASSLQHI